MHDSSFTVSCAILLFLIAKEAANAVKSNYSVVLLAILVLAVATIACDVSPQAIFMTPAPTTAIAQPTRGGPILPGATVDARRTVLPSPTALVRPSLTPTPRMAQSAVPTTAATTAAISPTPTRAAPTQAVPTARPTLAAPTADPNLVVITERDIEQALAGGAGEEQGLSVQGLKVRFADDKMTVSAEELAAGPVQVRNLVMVGRLVAQDGQLQFESESVSPRGLVTSMLPAIANQALAQYASAWYVEEVHTRKGRLEIRIR